MNSVVCPACSAAGMQVFYTNRDVPAHSCLLFSSAEAARTYPRASLTLAHCPGCGFVSNSSFDVRLNQYSRSYEETQGFSPRFRAFTRELATRWIDSYGLRDKTILEIGCGKGEFLVEMCEIGNNRGIGIDPAYVPERLDSEASGRLTFIEDLYSQKYAHLKADAIVCRHTLEHIYPVGDFMRTLRYAIGDRTDTIVLFELPDVLRVLTEVAFWDIYYEHCSYFTLGSLARLFRATGFQVLNLSLEYGDQYVVIEARPCSIPAAGEPFEAEDDQDKLAQAVANYKDSYQNKLDNWRRGVSGTGRTVLWGSGSKGVAYLTTLGLGNQIDCVVDINPFKHGMFMPGSGHRIVAPEALKQVQPDVVVAMNPIYYDEIRNCLDDLGVEARLIAV
ncbi:MAG: class I SAM-dependent methyltransferase [Actinomycetota bacterium]